MTISAGGKANEDDEGSENVWIAECNGCVVMALTFEEESYSHEDVREAVRAHGWVLVGDQHFCSFCWADVRHLAGRDVDPVLLPRVPR